MKILLIEDNPDHTEIIIDTLTEAYSQKLTITTTATFGDGLQKLTDNHYDLCLCDLKLPDSPLENTINVLSSSVFEAPIIVLTSINNDAIAIDLIKAGIQDFIAKDRLDAEYLYKQCAFAIERKATQKSLFNKTRDYEAFCHTLSHDFNGALRRVKQCTHLLNSSLIKHHRLTEEETQWLAFIEKNTDEIQRLTRDLFNYLSAEQDGDEQEFTDLNTLTHTAIDERKTAITLVKCDLPSVNVNPSQIQLALVNLIENAIKYNKNMPQIAFTHAIDHDKNEVIIYVDDNGIGIPEDKAASIFLPFKRLENTLNAPGSGLGLSLVQRVVQHIEGSISVMPSSSLGGSCFKICIPLHRIGEF